MSLNKILSPLHTLAGVQGISKKRTLEKIAELICESQSCMAPVALFDKFMSREKMGSTGFGEGFALPHCRLSSCQTPMAVFLQLAEPVDFDALDKKPVDLVFALVVPDNETQQHLQLLKQIAERFHDPAFCQRLRAADNSDTLFQVLTQPITA